MDLLKGCFFGPNRTLLSQVDHPLTGGGDVDPAPGHGQPFGLERVRRNILRRRIGDLRATAAATSKPLATTTVMTAAGERVHVMQRPHDGNMARNRFKKAFVIREEGQPMKMHDIHIDRIQRQTAHLGQPSHRKRLAVRVSIGQMLVVEAIDFFVAFLRFLPVNKTPKDPLFGRHEINLLNFFLGVLPHVVSIVAVIIKPAIDVLFAELAMRP